MSISRTAHERRSPEPADHHLDRIFGALSDRTRRAIIARLGCAPLKITDLAAPFDISLPAVSKHVRVLERAGLVRRTIDGRIHRCSLNPGPLEEAERWLSENRVFWEGQLEGLARFVEGDDDA